MGTRGLPLTPPQKVLHHPNMGSARNMSRLFCNSVHHSTDLSKKKKPCLAVSAKKVDNAADDDDDDESMKKKKESVFSNLIEALDFSQIRSDKDGELLEEAKEATQSGGRMSRQQYGALRRKIGGTYKDFFKSYVDVDGEYVEEGWVDKTCKICKKNTEGEERQVDKLGRYAHVACVHNKPNSGNFFSKLFS